MEYEFEHVAILSNWQKSIKSDGRLFFFWLQQS